MLTIEQRLNKIFDNKLRRVLLDNAAFAYCLEVKVGTWQETVIHLHYSYKCEQYTKAGIDSFDFMSKIHSIAKDHPEDFRDLTFDGIVSSILDEGKAKVMVNEAITKPTNSKRLLL
jgi:hypothetical protein